MSLILSGTDGLSDVDGSASTPAIRGTDTNTGIFFPAADTIAFAEGGAEVMRINSDGNVLIGGTQSLAKLTVNNGIVAVDESGVGTKQVYIRSNYSAVGPAIQVSTNDPLLFVTNNNERMRIDSSGNVLVGGTGLASAGNSYVTLRGGDNNSIETFRIGTGIRTHLAFFNGTIGSASSVGTIQTSGSNTSYNTSSDYRLKENIAPMTGALAKVALLKPCTFVWKRDSVASQGFIAHELAEVMPDCVSGEKDAVEIVDIKDEEGNVISQETKPVYQGIDTSFLVATLTAAIQEQQAIITDLKSRIETLEAK